MLACLLSVCWAIFVEAGGWQSLGNTQNTLSSPGRSSIPAPQLRVRYLSQDRTTDVAVDDFGNWFAGIQPMGIAGKNFSLWSYDEFGQIRWVASASARKMAAPVVLPDGSVAFYLDTSACVLYALNGLTGAEIAKATLTDCGGPAPVLRLDNDGALFVFGRSQSVALDAVSLQVLHTYLHSDLTGDASTAVSSKLVLVCTTEGLVAFNKTSGTIVWTYLTEPLQGAPLVAESQNVVVVLIQPPGLPDQLSCLSLATGAIQWHLNATVNAGFMELFALSSDGESLWCTLDDILSRINLKTHAVTSLETFRYLQKPIIVDPLGDLFFLYTPHLETLLLRVSPLGPTVLANYSAQVEALRCVPSLSAVVPDSRIWLGCLSGLAYLSP